MSNELKKEPKFKNYTEAYFFRKPWMRTMNSIRSRIKDKTNVSYPRYGGMGIKLLISSEDLKFLWFRDKAYELKRPSIDRIDPKGHYELSNCRFVELSINSSRPKSSKCGNGHILSKVKHVYTLTKRGHRRLHCYPCRRMWAKRRRDNANSV